MPAASDERRRNKRKGTTHLPCPGRAMLDHSVTIPYTNPHFFKARTGGEVLVVPRPIAATAHREAKQGLLSSDHIHRFRSGRWCSLCEAQRDKNESDGTRTAMGARRCTTRAAVEGSRTSSWQGSIESTSE